MIWNLQKKSASEKNISYCFSLIWIFQKKKKKKEEKSNIYLLFYLFCFYFTNSKETLQIDNKK